MNDREALHWIVANLLTDSQLDVLLPDGRPIRFILHRIKNRAPRPIDVLFGYAKVKEAEPGECPRSVMRLPWSHGPATEPHTCPFSVEVNNDSSLCNCCERCTKECAMDI